MKKILIMLLKVSLSAAIMGYLIYDAVWGKKNGNVFTNLVDQPKQWDALAGAFACCTTAVLITFVRWWYLVRALDVPCRLSDAIRIGLWGFLFNLAPLGIVGGDLVKTVMLSHAQPKCRAKALASVLVDRIIGLYVLFIVASVAILLTGFWHIETTPILETRYFTLDIYEICLLMFGVTIASTIGLFIIMGPDMTNGRVTQMIGRIPRIGPPLESLVLAVRMFNSKPIVLTISSIMSVGVHCLFAVGCYLIACGLPGNHLTLSDHFVVMPLSAAMQVIPLPIGPTEAVLEYLYTHVPVAGVPIAAGQGLIVALVYRLITVLIAVLGVLFYFGSRREMAQAIHEAEEENAIPADTSTGRTSCRTPLGQASRD